jgi:hypothetical protein
MTENNWAKHFKIIEAKTKQRWKVRKDGDTRKTVEIVHLGQQTLKRV